MPLNQSLRAGKHDKEFIMRSKIKMVAVALIGLLMAMGLVLIGCESPGCSGSGECTVTIDQGTSGLYVDSNSPRSSCGKRRTYNYDTGNYDNGCKVQENIDNYNRKYGTQSCDC